MILGVAISRGGYELACTSQSYEREWLRSSFSTWTIPPLVNAFVTRGVKPFIVYKEVGLFLFLSLLLPPPRPRARARIPLRPLRPPRRPHREGVAWLARQPASSCASQPFPPPGLIRCRRENDNRFIHMRATRTCITCSFSQTFARKRSLAPPSEKNSTFVESSRYSSSPCVFQVLTFFPQWSHNG